MQGRSVVSLTKNFKFRLIPENLERFIGESLKIFLNDSSVSSCQFPKEKFNISRTGENSLSCVGFENLFHGHTSWQTSQPKIQLANFPSMSRGIIISFNSIVK